MLDVWKHDGDEAGEADVANGYEKVFSLGVLVLANDHCEEMLSKRVVINRISDDDAGHHRDHGHHNWNVGALTWDRVSFQHDGVGFIEFGEVAGGGDDGVK